MRYCSLHAADDMANNQDRCREPGCRIFIYQRLREHKRCSHHLCEQYPDIVIRTAYCSKEIAVYNKRREAFPGRVFINNRRAPGILKRPDIALDLPKLVALSELDKWGHVDYVNEREREEEIAGAYRKPSYFIRLNPDRCVNRPKSMYNSTPTIDGLARPWLDEEYRMNYLIAEIIRAIKLADELPEPQGPLILKRVRLFYPDDKEERVEC
jgi:hypothetical protein